MVGVRVGEWVGDFVGEVIRFLAVGGVVVVVLENF